MACELYGLIKTIAMTVSALKSPPHTPIKSNKLCVLRFISTKSLLSAKTIRDSGPQEMSSIILFIE